MRSAEQRRSIRLAVSPERASAVLRIGRRRMRARLLNESSGGLAVQLDRESLVTSGQTLVLGTAAGWCRVRVVYLQRNDEGLYVGLQRLGDLPIDWHRWRIFRIWPLDRLRVAMPGLGWSYCTVGGLLVCAFVLAAVYWQVFASPNDSGWMPRGGNMPTLGGRELTGFSPSPPGETAPTSSSPGSGTSATGTLRGSVERELERGGKFAGEWARDLQDSGPKAWPDLPTGLPHVGDGAQDLAEIVNFSTAELPDASLLLSPDVEKKLQITPEQRAEILSIVRSGNDEAEAVYGNATDTRSSLVRLQVTHVRRAASERAVAVLTAPQKKQLKSLRKR